MRSSSRRTRQFFAVLAASAMLGGCVQFGSGRGQGFPEEHGSEGEDFEGEEIVDETDDDVGVEAEEVDDQPEE